MYSEDKKSFNGRKIFIQNGYECIDDGTGVKYIHRLIMEEHLQHPLTSDEEVHHKDENKRHNEVSNFELKNKSEHSKHHWDPEIQPDQKGSKNSQSKLTEQKVTEILKKVKSMDDIQNVADKYNVGYHCIWGIYKGNSWKHVPR